MLRCMPSRDVLLGGFVVLNGNVLGVKSHRQGERNCIIRGTEGIVNKITSAKMLGSNDEPQLGTNDQP